MDRTQQASVIFNTVSMMRMRSKRTVLITESNNDTDLYKKFVEASSCFMSSANDRSSVIMLLERFARNRVPATVGIVDADDDFAVGRKSPHPNIARTDATDKETTIIESPAFDAFCTTEHASLEPGVIRREVFAAVHTLGLIRRYSAINNWGLDFKAIRVRDFLDLQFKCDENLCKASVLANNSHVSVTIGDLDNACIDPNLLALGASKIVRGHDATAVLALRSRELFQQNLEQREIERRLSESYLMQHFNQTQTFQELRTLEQAFPAGFTLFS